MKMIDKQTLILSSVCHILAQLKRIDDRVSEIEMNTSDIYDRIAEESDEKEDEPSEEECSAAALADQLLDAADEIEDGEMVPMSEAVAEQLRAIAEELRG